MIRELRASQTAYPLWLWASPATAISDRFCTGGRRPGEEIIANAEN